MESITSNIQSATIPVDKQVWYITGATSGIGLSIATLLLNKGAKVTGTSRDLSKISKLDIFSHPNFLGLQVDIVDRKQVKESIEKTIKHFGDLSHVVNNAGTLIVGAIEEVPEEDSRALMDALYFGPINVINAALPHLRSKKDGYIFNISSIAGIEGQNHLGYYSAAKFALVGMTEALAVEVKPFNIKVSVIYLGYVVTGITPEFTNHTIPEYQTYEVAGPAAIEGIKKLTPADSNKIAQVILEYANKSEIPVNIFLGAFETFYIASRKIKYLSNQIELQKERNSDVVLELPK